MIRNIEWLLVGFVVLGVMSGGRILAAEKVVYLTFDADPTPKMRVEALSGKIKVWYDPSLINYLKADNAPGTIFTTGMFAELYPNVIKNLHQAGFRIENHTYDHRAFTANCQRLAFASTTAIKTWEITETQKIIQRFTGETPTYFRFPGLCHTAADDQLVAKLGLKIARPEIAAGDAFNRQTKPIVSNILRQVKDQAVIVLHLGGPNAPQTLAALKIALPKLKQRGYIFKTL